MTEYIVKCNEFVGISGKTMQFPEYIDTNQEIVRCRDCRHHHEGMCMLPDGMGDFKRWYVDDDGYCSDGEMAVGV